MDDGMETTRTEKKALEAKEGDALDALEATADITVPDENATESDAEEFANKIVRRAASLRAVKIDRESFLRTELKKRCPTADIDLAVKTTPAEAGIEPEVIDQIALAAIDFEVKKCAALSFLSGIPGGAALAATVPADLAQYFAHVMRIEQKLAYVYGWQTFLNDEDEVDDETVMQLVVLMGVMMGVGSAASSVSKFATKVAQESVVKTIQRQALTKTTFYPIMKKVLGVVGVKLTKQTFAKAVGKVVPVVGGAVSGGMTYASFKPGAERLRLYLRALPVSGVGDIPGREDAGSVGTAASKAHDAVGTVVAVARDTASEGARELGSSVLGKAKSAARAFKTKSRR